MKTISLLMGAFLVVLASGCNSESYGPASPDFYPNDSPPFTKNSAPSTPAPAKVMAPRTSPVSNLAATAAITPDTRLAGAEPAW